MPYVNIHILSNGTLLGQASARKITIVSGANDNIPIEALWHPSGMKGEEIGKELLSQYISGGVHVILTGAAAILRTLTGYNTTLTLKTHNGTIPSQPSLGEALSALEIEIPTPKLRTPGAPDLGGDKEKGPKFIEDATVPLALF